MARQIGAPVDPGLGGMFKVPPESGVHTSAAAEAGFLLGVGSLLAAPFSAMFAVAGAMAVFGILFCLVGVATTSRPDVSGRMLAPVGLLFAIVAVVLLGLRYVGLDTAFGDTLGPSFLEQIEHLNSRLPKPQ